MVFLYIGKRGGYIHDFKFKSLGFAFKKTAKSRARSEKRCLAKSRIYHSPPLLCATTKANQLLLYISLNKVSDLLLSYGI